MNPSKRTNSYAIGGKREPPGASEAAVKKQKLNGPSLTRDLMDHQDHSWSFQAFQSSPIVAASGSDPVAKRKKRATWTKLEDERLIELVKIFEGFDLRWPQIARQINGRFESTRTGKQCRERWLNHLRPDIKKGKWTKEEEEMIDYFYNTFGPKWSTMAKLIKHRTDNDLKNKWNSMKRARTKARNRNSIRVDNDTISDDKKMPCFKEDQHIEIPEWTPSVEVSAPQHIIDDNPLLEVVNSHHVVHSLHPSIAPAVTDGGSAENSPIPEKKYWEGLNYEV